MKQERNVKMERAVLYARVSGDDRAKDGRNLNGQVDMCREYALKNGWQVVAELAEDDRGASGASFELPQLNAALELARLGSFDILVVREIDRLSRKLAKQLIVEEEFKRYGVQIEYVLGEYDNTPEGMLMKNVRAVIAEYEREKTIERTSRARRLKVKSGSVLVFSNPPFGYDVEKDEKDNYSLVINEQQAHVVRLAFDLYTTGHNGGEPLSFDKVARELTDMEIPSPAVWKGQASKKKSDPCRWNSEVIRRMVMSETYAGIWHYGKYGNDNGRRALTDKSSWIPIEVPAIVSHEQWDAAQKQRRTNQRFLARNTINEYLLRQRITCGNCGIAMRSYTKNQKRSYFYYMCMRRNDPMQYAHSECDARLFRAKEVDSCVWNWITSVLTEPERLKEGIDAYLAAREKVNAPLLERIAILEGLIERNRIQLARLIDRPVYLRRPHQGRTS